MSTQIPWVRGNNLPLAIPLEMDVITESTRTTEAYIPPEGSTIVIVLSNDYERYAFTPTMNLNVAEVVIDASVNIGDYAVETLVSEPDGTPRRSKWCNIISIRDCNDGVVEEWGEFAEVNGAVLDSSIFYFAKGDKGDEGVGIASITQVSSPTESGASNVIRVTLTDGTATDFMVRNGSYATPEYDSENKVLII